jgi:hypothetical protein
MKNSMIAAVLVGTMGLALPVTGMAQAKTAPKPAASTAVQPTPDPTAVGVAPTDTEESLAREKASLLLEQRALLAEQDAETTKLAPIEEFNKYLATQKGLADFAQRAQNYNKREQAFQQSHPAAQPIKK